MQTVSSIQDLRDRVGEWRRAGESIAFVPTMGNLHAGHLQLVRHARTQAPHVVVSIFVNPMQFGPDEDFDSYPRTLSQDRQKLEELQVELLFAPSLDVIYPAGLETTTRVEVPGAGEGLCADFRPGFFVGVATVVARLFNLVQPQVAVFGEKDYQQLVVIQRMVKDLCWPIEVEGVPTVRESDGLAMSSRNQYLTAEQREQAPVLYQTLRWVADRLGGTDQSFRQLETGAMKKLEEAGFRPDYVCIRHAQTLEVAEAGDSESVVLAAASLGKARLIDNVRV